MDAQPLPQGDDMATESELRRASDDFLAQLDELNALEQLKRDEAPGSDEFVGLATRIEALSRELLKTSEEQAALATEASEMRAAGSPDRPERPIAEVEPRDPTTILAEWRDLERRLASGDGELEPEAGRRRANELRDEYRMAFERRARGVPG
jgi:hypothetical protein